MSEVAIKPVDLRRDLSDLRKAAAGTVADSGQLVCDTVRRGADVAGDKLNALRAEAVRMGVKGATAIQESGQAVAEHPVVFGAAAAAIATASYVAGRHEKQIVGAAHKLADQVKRIPGQQIAKDAGLVALGAALSIAIQHATKE